VGLLNGVRDIRTIKRLFTQAEAEARNSGEETPGPEHLLLAATALPDGTAAQSLERVGIDPQRLRSAIEEVHASALAAVGIEVERTPNHATALHGSATGLFRSAPQAQRVFQEAVALSKTSKPRRLLGAHVVAATCDLQYGTVARALTALGVERDRLREAARAEARGR
jgi:ATP-dependent Clp protease ATP-binding subunit ClpA